MMSVRASQTTDVLQFSEWGLAENWILGNVAEGFSGRFGRRPVIRLGEEAIMELQLSPVDAVLQIRRACKGVPSRRLDR